MGLKKTPGVKLQIGNEPRVYYLAFDTFRDERRAYSFICNPLGVQFDAMMTDYLRRHPDAVVRSLSDLPTLLD